MSSVEATIKIYMYYVTLPPEVILFLLFGITNPERKEGKKGRMKERWKMKDVFLGGENRGGGMF